MNQISTYISQTVPMYATWLKDVHFRFFCDSFVGYDGLENEGHTVFADCLMPLSSFIPRLIENIYKCRQISEIGKANANSKGSDI